MKWKEMSVFYKTIHVFRVLSFAAAMFLIFLDIAGILENGLVYAFLCTGADNLCIGIENWKEQKGLAIFSLAVAAFIFISQIYVLLIL